MRILRASDYRVMPWKNGGGTTTEIAVSPEGAGLDDFDWRISMARVEQNGPFSTFPGIDRTLSILNGEGLILDVSGRIPFGLTRSSEPLAFPADATTSARLISGPITDLNIMSRRARMSHSVQRLTVSGAFELAAEADTTLIFCHEGEVQVDGIALGLLDTFWIDSSQSTIRLSADEPAIVFVIRIRTVG